VTGIITKFDDKRGFGLIRPLVGDGPDSPPVFFHITAVRMKGNQRPAIPKGAEVSFDLCRGDKGPQAANVTLRKVNGRELRKEKD
jgi:cold shock CspA family protein